MIEMRVEPRGGLAWLRKERENESEVVVTEI
jgi:hypothetical protein